MHAAARRGTHGPHHSDQSLGVHFVGRDQCRAGTVRTRTGRSAIGPDCANSQVTHLAAGFEAASPAAPENAASKDGPFHRFGIENAGHCHTPPA